MSKRKGSLSNTPSKSTTNNPPLLIKKSSLPSNQEDLLQLDDSANDQQWHTVSSNKGQRKGNTNRRDTTDESQTTNATNKVVSADSGKYLFYFFFVYQCYVLCTLLSYSSSFVVYCFVFAYFIEKPIILTSSSRTHSSISRESMPSRRHHSNQNPSLTSVPPTSIKRKSLKDNNTPIIVTNRELAFRQLTEQLWAAGLPSSTTACSMSVHSRCSSAPPSERDGGEDETRKPNWNNDDDDDDEEDENIDWDEPNIPDEGNSSCLKILAIF